MPDGLFMPSPVSAKRREGGAYVLVAVCLSLSDRDIALAGSGSRTHDSESGWYAPGYLPELDGRVTDLRGGRGCVREGVKEVGGGGVKPQKLSPGKAVIFFGNHEDKVVFLPDRYLCNV